METFSIDTADGKYGIRIPPSGEPYATRHGLMWRRLDDEPHVLCLARDLAELRTALADMGESPLAQGDAPASYGPEGHLLDLPISDGSRVIQAAAGGAWIETATGARTDIPGDKLVLALAYEIEGGRARLDQLRAEQGDPSP